MDFYKQTQIALDDARNRKAQLALALEDLTRANRQMMLANEKMKNLRQIGIKTAYHTCGKMMAQLEQVKRIGCDASETLTPPDMGGDADLRKIKETLGDTMCLIGGFDQQKGFENGNPEAIRKLIQQCWEEAGSEGGYIMAASDHFFEGSPENIQTYVDIAREFRY